METIKDCFGNTIQVTDKAEAIRQAGIFVSMSEGGGFVFDEFKIVKGADQFGKPSSYSQQTKSGKFVRQRLYWKHTLHQLLKL